jgi:putative hydrolase of the HAD superfamily
MPSAGDLDAVTVDAAGTCLELVDPVPRLRRVLADRGLERTDEEVAAAFTAEVAYYLPRSEQGRDAGSLAGLRRDAIAVFLEHARAELDAESFVPAFMSAIEFRPAAGAEAALATLRSAGLELACVANWDTSLHDHLERAGLAHLFTTAVSSAEAGAAKPDPAVFELALGQLGISPSRALHIGDDEADREGARAAGMAFEPVPLATLPERLGLRGARGLDREP